MLKKYVLIIVVSIVVIILSIMYVSYKSFKLVNTDIKVNIEDGLQKEELENLNEDDYRKLNFPDIQNLGLDEVDNNYYYSKIENPDVIKDKATREEREKIYFYRNNLKELVLEMCKKNGDWSLLVYSDTISGYNQKDGLLKGFDYNEIEASDIVGSDDYGGYVDVIARNDKEERRYRVTIGIEDGGIQNINVKLGEIIKRNTNTEADLNKLKFDKEHTKENFINLSKYESAYKGGLDWYGEDIGITDNFYTKYPYFLDIFIHYSPLEYNKITLKDLDINNQTAIFEVDSVLECKRRTYEVKYILDNKMYLEDVNIKIKSEVNIENSNPKRMEQTFYLNGNLNNIKITNKFKDRIIANGSTFPDIEKLGCNFSFERNKNMYDALMFEIRDKKYQIRKFNIENEWVYYLWYYILDNNNFLDDVVYEKLPYDSSMTLEEVKAAYIRDYVEKK